MMPQLTLDELSRLAGVVVLGNPRPLDLPALRMSCGRLLPCAAIVYRVGRQQVVFEADYVEPVL